MVSSKQCSSKVKVKVTFFTKWSAFGRLTIDLLITKLKGNSGSSINSSAPVRSVGLLERPVMKTKSEKTLHRLWFPWWPWMYLERWNGWVYSVSWLEHLFENATGEIVCFDVVLMPYSVFPANALWVSFSEHSGPDWLHSVNYPRNNSFNQWILEIDSRILIRTHQSCFSHSFKLVFSIQFVLCKT